MKPISILAGLFLILPVCVAAQENSATTTSHLAALSAVQDTNPPPDFVEVEKEPTIVTRKEPVYPEVALRSGLEGVVWLKVWVNREGKPRQVQVLKSDNQVFNQSAMDAVNQWTFTPAMKDGKPVSVWVSIPFKFKLWKEPEEMKRSAEDIKKAIDRPTVVVVRGPRDLKKMISYPRQAIEKRIEGAVFTSVTLSDSLTVTEIKITKGLDKNCDRAVLAGISNFDFSTDKDIAAKKESGPVSVVVQFVLPEKK